MLFCHLLPTSGQCVYKNKFFLLFLEVVKSIYHLDIGGYGFKIGQEGVPWDLSASFWISSRYFTAHYGTNVIRRIEPSDTLLIRGILYQFSVYYIDKYLIVYLEFTSKFSSIFSHVREYLLEVLLRSNFSPFD